LIVRMERSNYQHNRRC